MADRGPQQKASQSMSRGKEMLESLFRRRKRTRIVMSSQGQNKNPAHGQSNLGSHSDCVKTKSTWKPYEYNIQASIVEEADNGDRAGQESRVSRMKRVHDPDHHLRLQRRRAVFHPQSNAMAPDLTKTSTPHACAITSPDELQNSQFTFTATVPVAEAIGDATQQILTTPDRINPSLQGQLKQNTTFNPSLDGEASPNLQPNLSTISKIVKNMAGTSTYPSLTQRPAQMQPDRLAFLRLSASKPAVPKIDKATPVVQPVQYIRSHIPFPENDAKLYRNYACKPEFSKQVVEGTIPDVAEVKHFLHDCQSELTLVRDEAKSTFNPMQSTRVPVGARLGALENGLTGEIGDEHTKFVKSEWIAQVRLPHHVAIARKLNIESRLATSCQSDKSDNLYTSSMSIASAYANGNGNGALKRRREDHHAVCLPPNRTFERSGSKAFNVFRNGILLYPELCLLLASKLPITTLVDLYSVSKDFHIIINQRFTTVILNQATLKAPHAARCYPWRCFKHLSQPDPALAAQNTSLVETGANINIRPAPIPSINIASLNDPHVQPHIRRVPTFSWLRLAIHREKVIHNLYHAFAARGVPLPGAPTDSDPRSFCSSLHKTWFIFDIPDNARRIQYAHTKSLLSDSDLANILTFIVKLDMLCNDPLGAEKRDALRKMMFTSVDGFSTILKVVKREIWRTDLDMFRAWARYGFQLDREDGRERRLGGGYVPLGLTSEEDAASRTVFGVPRDEVGILKREGWGGFEYDHAAKKRKELPKGVQRGLPQYGRPPMYLIRPDQLVLRETVKRGYRFGKGFLKAVLEGYVDERTLEAVPPRDLNGGRSLVLEKEGEYGVDDVVAGLQALDVEEGGDAVLDVGSTWKGSENTLQRQSPKQEELVRRQGEKDSLKSYMAAWRLEVEMEKNERSERGYRTAG